MRELSVVIPSKTVSNLVPCLSAIFANEKDLRVIVVDDGLEYPNAEIKAFCHDPRVTMVKGVPNFIFARNVNLGIKACGPASEQQYVDHAPACVCWACRDSKGAQHPVLVGTHKTGDDIIILNDDALLETPGGFTALQRCAIEHPEFGVISSACNTVGNTNQHLHPGAGLREEPRTVCFICVLIPRSTIDSVGLLDEEFVNYGMEDDSYCLRTRRAGFKLGIFDGCFVDHSKLKSTFRGGPNIGGDFRPNMKIFIKKYGLDNWGQTKETSQFKDCFPA